jgi:hypothetical protein
MGKFLSLLILINFSAIASDSTVLSAQCKLGFDPFEITLYLVEGTERNVVVDGVQVAINSERKYTASAVALKAGLEYGLATQLKLRKGQIRELVKGNASAWDARNYQAEHETDYQLLSNNTDLYIKYTHDSFMAKCSISAHRDLQSYIDYSYNSTYVRNPNYAKYHSTEEAIRKELGN